MSEFKDKFDTVNAATVHTVHGVPVILAPEGYELHKLTGLLPAPVRHVRNLQTQTVDSFIDYATRHSNALGFSSAVFHDIERNKFTFIADNDMDSPAEDLWPAWQHHKATYQPVRSVEFTKWLQLDGKWIGQPDLADFFEDREDDFVTPTGAEIYQLVTNLNLKRNVTVASAIDQRDGTFAIQYAEEKGKGSVELPETLELGLSPFKNGPRYSITAKLRYRVQDGKVAFQIKLRNADKVLDAAFEDVVQKIKTGLPDVQHYTASAW